MFSKHCRTVLDISRHNADWNCIIVSPDIGSHDLYLALLWLGVTRLQCNSFDRVAVCVDQGLLPFLFSCGHHHPERVCHIILERFSEDMS